MMQINFYSNGLWPKPEILKNIHQKIKQLSISGHIIGVFDDSFLLATDFSMIPNNVDTPVHDSSGSNLFYIGRRSGQGIIKYVMIDQGVEVASIWRPKHRIFRTPEKWKFQLSNGTCIYEYPEHITDCGCLANRITVRVFEPFVLCTIKYSSYKASQLGYYKKLIMFFGCHCSSLRDRTTSS